MFKKESTKSTNEEFNRPAVVTVMGHVDHGKTSLLDALRHTNIVDKEYGGITQHIGAYQIEYNSKKITFIDTPGHQAFSQMRARGGRASDIVILVVSSEEGVKPQTKEAISHAKAAGVPIIVAITKMDLPSADPKKVKQQLSLENILVEDWGGDVICVEISAKAQKNLDKLLEAIITVWELLNLKSNLKGELEAVIIESKLDSKKGVVVSCIIKNGTLHIGDKVTASGHAAIIKSIMDDKGQLLKEALPSTPVEILGFKKVPGVGDLIVTEGSELAQLAVDINKVEIIGKETKKTVAIIIRADTQGTLEAVKASLASLISESVGSSFSLKFLHCATGEITDSDVMLAHNSHGIVVGFNTKLPASIADLAESLKVRVNTYKTIYELIDEVKVLLEGTAFDAEAKIKGRAQVLKIFKLPSGDIIAGCKVIAGALKENAKVSIFNKDPADYLEHLAKNPTLIKKEEEPVFFAHIKKLKKGKDDISVVGKDNECGVLLKPQYEGISIDQWLEVH